MRVIDIEDGIIKLGTSENDWIKFGEPIIYYGELFNSKNKITNNAIVITSTFSYLIKNIYNDKKLTITKLHKLYPPLLTSPRKEE